MSLDGNAIKISERIGEKIFSVELNSLKSETCLEISVDGKDFVNIVRFETSEEVSMFVKMLESAQDAVDIL